MTAEEIEAFFSDRAKRLPASPVWRDHSSRVGEQKARLPIEANGVVSQIELEMTLKFSDPDYLVAVLIAPPCIARMCIGVEAEHNNRVTGEAIEGPHFHDWSMNRHLPKREAFSLPYCIPLPSEIVGKDAAFSWFLSRVGIESPDWLPVKWPTQGGMF
ncbi:hypothetical protein [Sphingobium sp.]|uniref:hypothetical protein n=1 Tax=Sphingobium sp. TaxID=1912891 RepID=UPI002D0A6238|nr:hypothetical protein [Sphingobium sp.]HUD91234.1 hypothetical protein [Sphingobium sp.]